MTRCEILNYKYFKSRLAAMTLSPMENRRKIVDGKNTKRKSVTWNDRQLAVTKLINEASALIDIFNEVSCMIGPEMDLKCSINMAVQSPTGVNIPESKWQPILSESCSDLQRTLTHFKPNSYMSSTQLMDLPNKSTNN